MNFDEHKIDSLCCSLNETSGLCAAEKSYFHCQFSVFDLARKCQGSKNPLCHLQTVCLAV